VAKSRNKTDEEVLNLLPGTITDVVSVSPTSRRLLIQVDQQPFVELSSLFLQDCPLDKGEQLDLTRGKRLLGLKRQEEVFNYGLRALGRRNHTLTELSAKAKQKGYEEADIKPALRRLVERGLIDEYDFALSFCREKLNHGGWGPEKIRAALLKKGVPGELIDQAQQQIVQDVDWLALMRKQVAKKRSRFLKEPDINRRRKKMFDYLVRKGYNRENIWQFLDQLISDIEDE